MSTQHSLGKESSRDFQTRELRLIVACLTIAAGQFPMCSLHLIAFQWVPCTLLNGVVRTFLPTKSFAVGSSTDPCHLACILKSVPKDVISLIQCCTQLPRSAVGVTRVSQGWLLSILFSWPPWSSGFLRVVLMMPRQSRESLMRHLKVLIAELLKLDR
jgi:hypothetical protein